MKNIYFDYSNTTIKKHEVEYFKEPIVEAHKMLHNKTGAGSDFVGWVDYPVNYDQEEFERIKNAAEKIRNNSEVFVVVGIGGSDR